MPRIPVHTTEFVPRPPASSPNSPAVFSRLSRLAPHTREALARHTARDRIIEPQAGRVPFLNDR